MTPSSPTRSSADRVWPEGQCHSDGGLDDARYERKESARQDLRPPSQRPPGILRDPAIRLAVDPRPAASLGEVADAGHVIGAFLDADDAARLEIGRAHV